MRHVALEIGIPAPRHARDRVQLDERADERLGIPRERDGAQIARGLVLLAIANQDRK